MTKPKPRPITLTENDVRILSEIATGDGYEVVAERLYLSVQHVKNTANKARRFYGVTTTIGVMVAMGWLNAPMMITVKVRPKRYGSDTETYAG